MQKDKMQENITKEIEKKRRNWSILCSICLIVGVACGYVLK